MSRSLASLNIAAFRTMLAGALALALAATATPAAAGQFHGGGGFHGGGFGGGGFHPQMGFGSFHHPFDHRFVFVDGFHHRFNRRFGFLPAFSYGGYDYSGYDAYYGCWQRVWGPLGWRVVYVCD